MQVVGRRVPRLEGRGRGGRRTIDFLVVMSGRVMPITMRPAVTGFGAQRGEPAQGNEEGRKSRNAETLHAG